MLETDREAARQVEAGLASAGKLKILRLLMEKPDHAFTRYEIGKRVTSDPISIRNDLNTLVEIGWVTELKIQHLTKYSINLDNEIVKRLAAFFKEIKYVR